MANPKKRCLCGRTMKQQFIGLKHCSCGISWSKQNGYFERTPNMKFKLKRQKVGNKIKQVPIIVHMQE